MPAKSSTRAKARASKTITIDAEAYQRLRSHQTTGETLSDVIRKVVTPPVDLQAVLSSLAQVDLSKQSAAATLAYRDERRVQANPRRKRAS